MHAHVLVYVVCRDPYTEHRKVCVKLTVQVK